MYFPKNEPIRMKFFWFLIFAIASALNGYSQSFSAVIVDDQNLTLQGAQIKDTINNISVFSNEIGKFTIELKSNSVFEITLNGYESEFIYPFALKDTIQIFADSRLLESVTVNTDKINVVLDRPSLNVLDYLVYAEYFLVLYSERSQKFLSINENSGAQKKISLGRLNGKSLIEDCFGNVHLLTKDKAYRLLIGQEIAFDSEVSLAEFNEIIKPCEAASGSNLIISEYTNHNQKYTLALKVKPEKQFTPFFQIWDHETETTATELYWEIVGMYTVESDTISNVIINKVWDWETLRELAITPEIIQYVGFYDGVVSKGVNVHTFQLKESLVVFDLCFDSLHIFNKDGAHLSAISTPRKKTNMKQKVCLDRQREEFYLIDFNKGLFQFSRINLTDGSLETSFVLTEQSFPENVQIFDGSLYFLAAKNGFHKLYKVRLE